MLYPKGNLVDDILRREHENVQKQKSLDINSDLTPNNYEAFEERIDCRQLSEEFVQCNKLRGIRRSFQIYRNAHLFQMFDWYRDKKKRKYRINLACLNARPEHQLTLEWKWLTTALATAIWSLILIYTASFTSIPDTLATVQPQHLVSAGVLMATITVISLLLFVWYRRDKTVYRCYQSGLPLVMLDTDKPDPGTFRRLTRLIEQGIEASTAYRDVQERLVIELRELRRLRDEGIVSELDYENARDSIFSHHEYRSVST